MHTIDPLGFAAWLWPAVTFYDKQRDIIYSVQRNDRTIVPAGNMLGKDFVAAYIALWFFLCHHPVRIITTSVKDEHLDVLWGEIDRFIRTAKYPLTEDKGGPLVYNHHEIRKVVNGELDKYSYLKGQVSKKGEGMSGHHAKHTLLIGDEASGIEEVVHDMAQAWARKMLILGNTNPCENFFRRAVREGDRIAPDKQHVYQKIIKIKAEDSPNVRYAKAELAAGRTPTGRVLVPGVLAWPEYCQRRELFDPIKQSISLDAEFYEGPKILMYPPAWLDRAENLWRAGGYGSHAEAAGLDSAQGGDNTAIAVVNRKALLALASRKTPDTTEIVDDVLDLLRRTPSLRPEKVFLDMGGGGKQHGDRLRSLGYDVRMVYFGAAATPDPSPGLQTAEDRMQKTEQRSAYRNKRAEMYGLLRRYLDPAEGKNFALPPELLNRPRLDGGPSLREQMQAVPLSYDEEGKLYVIPKNKRNQNDTRKTLTDVLGCSPDELDALVLAVYGLEAEEKWATVGVGY